MGMVMLRSWWFCFWWWWIMMMDVLWMWIFNEDYDDNDDYLNNFCKSINF
jgi:hypothetical protein